MTSTKEIFGRGGAMLHPWIHGAVQILVLASFSLQLFLFLVGGTRRRGTSAVLRVLLWLAYLSADTTATYTLGHLAITSGSHVHQLVAFWAPFLLLHLGGQDTISAYALEDNRLWLRHLQTLVVQFLGVAYVLYRYGSRELVYAAIFMFVLGALKYGERIWALKCANNYGIDSLMDKMDSDASVDVQRNLVGLGMEEEEEEVVMHGAHVLISICVSLFHDCSSKKTPSYQYETLEYLVRSKKMYKVIEMELSLMYDVMYTKAGVIHTWFGRCMRLFSLFVLALSFLLFHFFVNKDGYSTVDVVITYILIVGAFLLEMISCIMAIGSTWTRHLLYLRGCSRLLRVIVCLRRLARAGSWWRRSWSGNVGQFNIFDYATEHARAYSLNPKLEYVMDIHKLKDLSPPVKIAPHMMDLVLNEIVGMAERHGGEAQSMYSLNQTVKDHELPVLDCDFDTRIIIWHIATHALLLFIGNSGDEDRNYQKAIKTMSDYMVFLLVKQPEMLVAHTSRQLCLKALDLLKYVDTKEVVEYLRTASTPRTQRRLSTTGETGEKDPCQRGVELAKNLVGNGWERRHLLEVMFGAWVVMLCYAGSHCSRDSHARRLSSGGELLTVVWQLAGHLSYYESQKRDQARIAAARARSEEEDRIRINSRRSSMRVISSTGREDGMDVELGATSYSQIEQGSGEGAGNAAPDT